MAFRNYLIFLLFFLLVNSCAQVGQLSGGEKDIAAPRPIESKTVPPTNSTSFSGNSISMEFDEYVQLNNPSQTIVFVPNHANPTASLHKKTMTISWKETLEPATTYVVYLNGAVKDVTENNDSLMMYAFSTGSSIDSLQYSVPVVDAWSNRYLPGITVGLFTDLDAEKPYYYAKTGSNGWATFKYLKQGKYYVKAFNDENKDLQIELNESLAFRSEVISLDSLTVDSVSLRLAKPIAVPKITTFVFAPPNSFLVGANYPINQAEFVLNQQKIGKKELRVISSDSVQLFSTIGNTSMIDLVVSSETKTDSLTLRILEREKTKPLKLISAFNQERVGPQDALFFSLNDRISSMDASKISCMNKLDSTAIPFQLKQEETGFSIELNRTNYKDILVTFQKDAVRSISGLISEPAQWNVQLKADKEYGSLLVDLSAFNTPLIVELLQNDKVVERRTFSPSKKAIFSQLTAGEYSFRVIGDENGNGRWDTVNLKERKQPEKIYLFATPVKVRTNWEVETVLSPSL
jgi:uncharacterized protein (DUF2141 family)